MINKLICSTNMELLCVFDFDTLVLILIPFALILVSNEIIDKYTDWPREVHRKYGHILSGLLIILATYHLGFAEMVVFSVILMVGAVGTKMINFVSVEGVSRKTFGTFLFALVTLLLTLIWFRENVELLRYGIWILVVPDALAALIGSKWGKQIPKYQKSLLGSAVFFAGTIVVTLFFTQNILLILLIAVVLTIVEFFTRWGIDNLTLPLIASFLLLLM